MRKGQATIREIEPDSKYNSITVAKLINYVMLDGKKHKAENIVYDAFDFLKKETNSDELEIFNKAIENLKPFVELKSKRLGGSNLQIPIKATERRKDILSLRWLVLASRERNEYTMSERLAKEIIAASNEEGKAIEKRTQVHKIAESNKAFAHFNW